MNFAWPQTRPDFNPTQRPKGCINNYKSVVNTAKNEKLIRADLREYVLALGLYLGFTENKLRAQKLYPNNQRRIKQCTFLNTARCESATEYPTELLSDIDSLHRMLIQTLCCYYKQDKFDFYDTKKFYHYRNRLEYGKPDKILGIKKIDLTRTIQYMASPVLACMFAAKGIWTHVDNVPQLDIRNFDCIRRAYDIKKTDSQIQKYIDVVLHIPDIVIENGIILFTQKSFLKFCYVINNELMIIQYKLKEGGYIGKERN